MLFRSPSDDHDFTLRALRERLENRLRYSGDWPGWNWSAAPDAWTEHYWNLVGPEVIRSLAKVSHYAAQSQKIPVTTPSGLRIVNASAIDLNGLTPLPPTEAGWRSFLAEAPDSGLKFGELQEAGKWWWNRLIPRKLLAEGREEEEEEAA